jgi:hypothetical protein
MADLLACRTEALGGQLLPCEHGGQEHDVYHSCRHRSCPKCHRHETDDDGQVCLRHGNSRTPRRKTMTLPAQEFIRRFLQHVLPLGFYKVRYYGLWSPTHRSLLHQLQLHITAISAIVPPNPLGLDAASPPRGASANLRRTPESPS